MANLNSEAQFLKQGVVVVNYDQLYTLYQVGSQ